MNRIEELTTPLYRKLAGGRKNGQPVALALVLDPLRTPSVSVDRLSWTERIVARFREIARQAAQSELSEGKQLPYASLRAALETQIPEALLVVRDLGAPWRSADRRPFIDVPADGVDRRAAACMALKTWISLALRPWADRLGVSAAMVDGLAELATPDGAMETVRQMADLSTGGEMPFEIAKAAILQLAAKRLEGEVLFPGLGPVFRVIRSNSASSVVRFQTWPVLAREGGRYSMTASLSVETAPYLGRPVLVVEASRRLWVDELPSGSGLWGRRELTVAIMAKGRAPVAVEIATRIVSGKIMDPGSPEFLMQALKIRLDLARPLAEMIARHDPTLFVGVPYSTAFGRHPVGAGATTRDHLDVFDEVAKRLDQDGFSPLEIVETEHSRSSAPRRAAEYHEAIKAEALVAHVALSMGRNDLDAETLAKACLTLVEGGDPPEMDPGKAARARDGLETLRAANQARVQRAFGSVKPTVVLVAPTQRERATMKTAVEALFGNSVNLAEYALPSEVHGPIPPGRIGATARFNAQVEKWQPLAQTLSAAFDGCHVLVQARDWYTTTGEDGKSSKRKDDPVNKLAGRMALASNAKANVQYLLPPRAGWRGMVDYLNRIQSASYDLVFGHSGLVSEVGSLIENAFADADARPKSIIGISVVTQARLRYGALGGRLCMATRIDAATAQTTARIGWWDGGMRWSPSWEPFGVAMKRIAQLQASLGPDRAAERDSFQKFVGEVLDGAVRDGDRPLVLVDSTSAAGLWPWLTDKHLASAPTLGVETIVGDRWSGVRLARVRTRCAPRILERKTVLYGKVAPATGEANGETLARYAPTATARTVRVSEGPGDVRHYLVTAGYFQTSLPRGLSVYRQMTSLMPTAKIRGLKLPECAASGKLFAEAPFDISKETYRVPQAVDVTVAVLGPGDDPDLIAQTVASLRYGYGHTTAATTLPAPLSFESKARDYMVRFALSQIDLGEAGEGSATEDGVQDAEPLIEEEEAADLDEGATKPDEVECEDEDGDDPANAEQALPSARASSPCTLAPNVWEILLARSGVAAPTGDTPEWMPMHRDTATSTAALLRGMARPGPAPAYEAGREAIDGLGSAHEDGSAANQGVEGDMPADHPPLPPLPEYVNGDWLRSRLSIPFGVLRALHKERESIVRLSGFSGWPEEMPSPEDFPNLLAQGLRYPWFVWTLHYLGEHKKRDLNIFIPFIRLLSSIGRGAARRLKRSLPPKPEHVDTLRLLMDDGQVEMGRTLLLVHGARFGTNPAWMSAARAYQELGEMLPWLEAVEAAMEKGYPSLGPSGRPNPEDAGECPDAETPCPSDNGSRNDGGHGNDCESKEDMDGTAEETAVKELAPGAANDAICDPKMAWNEAMSAIVAAGTSSVGPDAETLATLESLLSDARMAYAKWLESEAQGIDSSDIVARVVLLATRLAPMSNGADFEVPPAGRLTNEAAAEADTSLALAEDAVKEAEEAEKQAKALMESQGIGAMEEIFKQGHRRERCASVGLDALKQAIEVIKDGVTVLPSPVSTPLDRRDDPEVEGHASSWLAQDRWMGAEDSSAATEDPHGSLADDVASCEAEVPYQESEDDLDAMAAAVDEVERQAGRAVVAPQQEPEPVEDAKTDPLAEAIDRRLEELVRTHEFGLAYHLIRAGERVVSGHEFVFSKAELRLAAVARYVNHASPQANTGLAELVKDVLDGVEDIQAGEELVPPDIAAARRLLVYASCVPLALFHQDLGADTALRMLNGIGGDLDEELHPLRQAVVEPTRLGFPVTPAMLRTASLAAEEDLYWEECRKRALEKAAYIANMQFAFTLGVKVRSTLAKGEGILAVLRKHLESHDEHAIEAVAEFASTHSDRWTVLEMLDKVSEQVDPRGRGLDGTARERLITNIQGLAAICEEYVQARRAAPALRNSAHKAALCDLRDAVATDVDRAVRALSPLTGEGATASSVKAAAEFAIETLRHFKSIVDGCYQPPGVADHLIAVHGALLWLPGLHFGSSWLPTPYQADRIVAAILSIELPAVPTKPKEDFAKRLDEAVRTRKRNASFVAARMLVETSAFHGVQEETRAELDALIASDVASRRTNLSDGIDEARRAVDRVQRMGKILSLDDAQRLTSLLDRIQPGKLPMDVSLDYRSEEEEGEQILDFCSAEALLADVKASVARILDGPRSALLAKLDGLVGGGKATGRDAQRVRDLLAKDDLPTAQEWTEFLVGGRCLPETFHANARFLTFFPAVPEALEKARQGDGFTMRRLVESGGALGPLDFGALDADRRKESVELVNEWNELRRRVSNGFSNLSDVAAALAHFLGRVGLGAEVKSVDKGMSDSRRKTCVAEMSLRFGIDAESFLLPDFGSQTDGNYRVCVVSKVPPQAEINQLCDNPGSLGVIILVMDVLDAERRRNLTVNCVEQNRRLLVIDEALFLFALAEREFRPLTLIECAQPFSFAAPYRDYGNAAVPREMFFGREVEQRKMFEMFGSCIVYGGRRLGKTALLKHVQNTKHDPAGGTVVAYVNILDVGPTPSVIWEYASRGLPDIFGEASVRSANDFTTRVHRWLDGDNRRRVLVLFDEADRFIEADAQNNFREFLALQGLMDGTGRRFKLVFAGLHNVTRLVHTENPPLKHIAADPLRIGPLMDDELKDAEALVTRPMAAMGYEFEDRGDVWRILSHCNYYPVLVQTFCQGLLEALAKDVNKRKRPLIITGEHIRTALEENEVIAREINEKFDYTISKIEARYELIAYVMAYQAVRDDVSGRVDEGVSAVDVAANACYWWPAAFDKTNRISLIEDLLDEMEGLGVLRRVNGSKWALRSHTILRLLGNAERIETKLMEFMERPAPPVFEPRSMRRTVAQDKVVGARLPAASYTCPLTMGQEYDLLACRSSVRIIFGSPLSNVELVGAFVGTFVDSVDDLGTHGTKKVDLRVRQWSTYSDLQEEIKEAVRPRNGAQTSLLVVDARSNWEGSWIEQALKIRAVRDEKVFLAFVGRETHALKWVRDLRCQQMLQANGRRIRVTTLEPWSDSLIQQTLSKGNLTVKRFETDLRTATGGFNSLMHEVASQIGVSGQGHEKFAQRLNQFAEKKLTDPGKMLADMGLVARLDEVMTAVVQYAMRDGRITPYDISDVAASEIPGYPMKGKQIADFCVLMGLLLPDDSTGGSEVQPERQRYAINPLLVAAAKASLAKGEP